MMKFKVFLLCVACLLTQVASAEEIASRAGEESAKSAATDTEGGAIKVISSIDLLNMLVKAGVLSRQQADDMLQEAVAEKSVEQIEQLEKSQGSVPVDAKTVRVPYIPEFIKDQIRDDVRIGLREEVVRDVIGQAEHERWGVPGALPSWVEKIKFSGDFRLRYQGDFFPQRNESPALAYSYLDFQRVNETESQGTDPSYFINRTEDRSRLRARFRLAMAAKVTQGIEVNARLATGKFDDPVSTNQTLGNSSKPFTLVLDRAYIRTKTEVEDFTFLGGRMPNPWLSTDLVWDSDLNFDGVALKYRPLASDDLYEDERIFDTSLTFGAFPLEEVELSSDDKWLYGFQAGFNWQFWSQNRLDIGIAYYDYVNITGKRNELGSDLLDYTAPDLIGSSNTAFNIANDVDGNRDLLGLAADYDIIDILVKFKYARFAPYNLVLTADYVRNVGYDENDVLNLTGGEAGVISNSASLTDSDARAGAARIDGYMLKVDFGWPRVRLRDTWNLSLAYRHLQRDAVVDIYTDSDFRGGGTDVEGWQLTGNYAVDDNAWLTLKLISANEIDGPPFSQETVQLDLNASF
jgi:hypothetical protein